MLRKYVDGVDEAQWETPFQSSCVYSAAVEDNMFCSFGGVGQAGFE